MLVVPCSPVRDRRPIDDLRGKRADRRLVERQEVAANVANLKLGYRVIAVARVGRHAEIARAEGLDQGRGAALLRRQAAGAAGA